MSTAVREALQKGSLELAAPDGGYPRFGNVNVGIAGRVLEQPDPQFVQEDAVATRLSVAIREALLRGNLDLKTPDGGYARFGNVNVGIGGRVFDQRTIQPVREGIATQLSTAITDALAKGHLSVATPDGGYARFGNVNVGIGGRVQTPGVADVASSVEREKGTESEG